MGFFFSFRENFVEGKIGTSSLSLEDPRNNTVILRVSKGREKSDQIKKAGQHCWARLI
jgi:hypothetical protein